ncbi:hypothetical protein SKAU_G00412980 [Synaphobranchus kaupii]|uniref:Uncharacterized protein n=1 Tax=Synaphobranchus kaupii TaxID=118154 RepID=A0A9Q1E853_SYNKA|nr:hypothetical protein SKAU_G00412980 [Synaphobranchus kaupii]
MQQLSSGSCSPARNASQESEEFAVDEPVLPQKRPHLEVSCSPARTTSEMLPSKNTTRGSYRLKCCRRFFWMFC